MCQLFVAVGVITRIAIVAISRLLVSESNKIYDGNNSSLDRQAKKEFKILASITLFEKFRLKRIHKMHLAFNFNPHQGGRSFFPYLTKFAHLLRNSIELNGLREIREKRV